MEASSITKDDPIIEEPLRKDAVVSDGTENPDGIPDEDLVESDGEQSNPVEEQLNKLDPDSDPDPLVEPKTYIIGKPPELGGDTNAYSVYVQRSMGYIEMLRWTGLVSKNIAEAIKAGGAVDLGDAFNSSTGTATERAKQIIENSFNDAGSFAALFFQLISYSPDLLLETYCYALGVPTDERRWAKRVMEQRWDPEDEKWGLKRQDGTEILERFLDQNYEEMRDFFTEVFEKITARVKAQENRRKARTSTSDLSK